MLVLHTANATCYLMTLYSISCLGNEYPLDPSSENDIRIFLLAQNISAAFIFLVTRGFSLRGPFLCCLSLQSHFGVLSSRISLLLILDLWQVRKARKW